MSAGVKKRRLLFEQQFGICYYCQGEMTMDVNSAMTVTVDHKIPTSRGGQYSRFNEVGACLRCNSFKDNMTEDEFRALYPDPASLPLKRSKFTTPPIIVDVDRRPRAPHRRRETGTEILSRVIAAAAGRI